MSSPTPENIGRKAELARNRAARSRFFMRAAAVIGVAVVVAFLSESLFFSGGPQKPPEPPPVQAAHVSGGLSSFSGIDDNAKPFSVKAQEGVQDPSIETLMHLKNVSGTFVRKLGGDVAVTADAAEYEVKKKDLRVSGNVRFEEPGRYVARLSSAEVNLDRQKIVTKEPVQVETAGATVSADSMETSEDGKVVILRGHVKAHFSTDVGD
ncbi:MAG: LPS export ABC transporter periplasmic protein LptC [Alphaproteobacteria bacterium]|nr:LPS export ABC transporter periplasmic protein LptC [Alphaproteobacteria bacterium]